MRKRGLTNLPSATLARAPPSSSRTCPSGATGAGLRTSNREALAAAPPSAETGNPRASATLGASTLTCAAAEMNG